MEENKTQETLYGFEKHTFDIVQKMLLETSLTLGKRWTMRFTRVNISKSIFTTVSVYEGDNEVYRSCLSDNAAEACMYITAFIHGLKAVMDIAVSR